MIGVRSGPPSTKMQVSEASGDNDDAPHLLGGAWSALKRRDGGDVINAAVSYPVPRKRERSLHTCAQDVQITRMATIDKQMQCYK
jgi:hypothetical protein